jgi:N-acyl-D-aspartate/D-glutamate deacylase
LRHHDRVADLLIRGATLVDGTGRPARQADLAVDAGRISTIGSGLPAHSAREVLDAGGLVVAPGFIDMHSHADFTLPAYPDALNSLAQGVTTEVVGNCGYSPAPLSDDPDLGEAQRAAARGLGPDLAWDWRSFGEFLDRLDAARPAVNCIALVGHGTLRLGVVGADDRAATPSELAEMRTGAAAALEAGAWGLSTGLVYPPGSFAVTGEIVAVGEPLAAAGGLYASHIRNENDGLAEALGEAVEIGRQLGVQVEVSHLKAAGLGNHGRAEEALGILDEARASGVRVGQDAYPYTAGSTLLTQLLPPWAQEGGIGPLVERLGSAETRERIARECRSGLPGWPNYSISSGGFDRITIAAVVDPVLAWLEGLTIAEAARRSAVDPMTLVFDTLVADRGATTMIVSLMDEADVDAILAHPRTAIGSDQLGVTAPGARVHPRAYGTFVRILGRYVRERAALSLETAIHRMTGLPASVLGLADRARLEPGAVADLVVFDPATVADASTYDEPTRLPVGVEAVLLGGRLAMHRGVALDPRLGRVLRRPVSRAGGASPSRRASPGKPRTRRH